MIGPKDVEEYPSIVIVSPVDEEADEYQDMSDDDVCLPNLLTVSGHEESGRLSALSKESDGRKSVLSRISGLSFNSAIYKFESVFLVTVFLIIAVILGLVGVFVGKFFLCDVSKEKNNSFSNATTAEDYASYQDPLLREQL